MSELTNKKKQKTKKPAIGQWRDLLSFTYNKNVIVFVSQTKVAETPAENPAPVTEQSGAE